MKNIIIILIIILFIIYFTSENMTEINYSKVMITKVYEGLQKLSKKHGDLSKLSFWTLNNYEFENINNNINNILYVSPDGSMNNSGDKENPTSIENVFNIIQNSDKSYIIYLNKGHYMINKTLKLHDIKNRIISFKGLDNVIISSLKKFNNNWNDINYNNLDLKKIKHKSKITSIFEVKNNNITMLKSSFSKYFKTDEETVVKASKGQLENNGHNVKAQKDKFNTLPPNNFKVYKDIIDSDLEVSITPWTEEILPINNIIKENNQHRIFTKIPAGLDMRKNTHETYRTRIRGSPSYLINGGDFGYYNKNVYVKNNIETNNLYYPTLTEIFNFKNCDNIIFDNITFSGCDFRHMKENDVTIQHDWAVVNKKDAIIRFSESCNNNHIRNCKFMNSNGTGLNFSSTNNSNSNNNHIYKCLFKNLGKSGLCILGPSPGYGPNSFNHYIYSNIFENCGLYKGASSALILDQIHSSYIFANYFKNLEFTAICLTGMRQMGYIPLFADFVESENTTNGKPDINKSFYKGREFRHFDVHSDVIDLMRKEGEEVGSLKAMKYTYNYNNIIEANLFKDICKGGGGQYMNGGIYTSGVPENKMNAINFNFFIDTVTHSRSNVIIYIDSDHDHCLINGNVIVNKKNNGDLLLILEGQYPEYNTNNGEKVISVFGTQLIDCVYSSLGRFKNCIIKGTKENGSTNILGSETNIGDPEDWNNLYLSQINCFNILKELNYMNDISNSIVNDITETLKIN